MEVNGEDTHLLEMHLERHKLLLEVQREIFLVFQEFRALICPYLFYLDKNSPLERH